MSLSESEATKDLAYNQGFYNLFLAIEVLAGLAVLPYWNRTIGLTLVLAGAAAMLAAALVLALKSAERRRPALVQGIFPLLGIVLITTSLIG